MTPPRFFTKESVKESLFLYAMWLFILAIGGAALLVALWRWA